MTRTYATLPETRRRPELRRAPGGKRGRVKITWKSVAPLLIWLALYLVPVPAGLNADQWHYFAIFAAVIAGLILESMPVGAVGLIGLTFAGISARSEERRVGKECRSRWSPYH